jgi:hypothetical protein
MRVDVQKVLPRHLCASHLFENKATSWVRFANSMSERRAGSRCQSLKAEISFGINDSTYRATAARGHRGISCPVAGCGVFAQLFLMLNLRYRRASQFAGQPPSQPIATAARPDKIDSFESGSQRWRN